MGRAQAGWGKGVFLNRSAEGKTGEDGDAAVEPTADEKAGEPCRDPSCFCRDTKGHVPDVEQECQCVYSWLTAAPSNTHRFS